MDFNYNTLYKNFTLYTHPRAYALKRYIADSIAFSTSNYTIRLQ